MKKIFISSTFRDMQSERDAIRNAVLPRVKDFLRKRGYDISFSDLRWGISTESLDTVVVMGKILSVCANEIDACRPYLVVLLGDRYGTIPEEQILKNFLDTHKSISYEEAQGKSITELEIIYALKKSISNLPVCLTICVRNTSVLEKISKDNRSVYEGKEEDKLRMERLKHFFTSNYSNDVLHYDADWNPETKQISGLDGFVDKLSNRLIEQLKSELPDEDISPEREQLNYDSALLLEQANRLAGREGYLGDIGEFFAGSDNVLFVRGLSGIGKTCLIAKAAQSIGQKSGVEAISLFLGNGASTVSLENILMNIVFRTSILLNQDVPNLQKLSFDELKLCAQRQVNELSKQKKVILFIDNIDALPPEEISLLFNYLPIPQDGNRYKLVISATNEISLPDNALLGTVCRTLEVFGISEDEVIGIIIKFLSENGKELGVEAMQQFREVALFRSPLYILLVTKRLLLLSQRDFKKIDKLSRETGIGGNRALSKYLSELIATLPMDEKSLAIELIDNISETTSFNSSKELLELMVASKEQLRVDDVLHILKTGGEKDICSLDIIAFIGAANGLLSVDGDGRIRFSHRLIREALCEKTTCESVYTYSNIFDYLTNLPNNDFVKQRLFLYIAYKADKVAEGALFFESISLEDANLGDSEDEKVEKRVYDNFQDFFYSLKKEREEIIKYLNNVSEYAATRGAKVFNAICQQVLYGIYHAVNKATQGRGNSEIQLLSSLYSKAKEVLLPAVFENKDYLRTVYMIAEKCGISVDGNEAKWEYFCEFHNYCLEFQKIIDDSYKHRDYAMSDLAHSFAKLANYQLTMYKRWREATDLYDMAIKAVSGTVKPSTERIDMLDYLKHDYTKDKYGAIISDAVFKNQLGWGEQDEFIERTKNAEKELKQCETFFENATANFVSAQRTMVLSNYWWNLMETRVLLSEFFSVKKQVEEQKCYLERALLAAIESNKIDGSMYTLDRIRNIYLRLGACDGSNAIEKTDYLKKAFDITEQLIADSMDEKAVTQLREVKNEIAGRLMKLRFESIHHIDTESDEFVKDSKNVFFREAKEINSDNFDFILSQCSAYLIETAPPILPSVASYRHGYEKTISTIFVGMLMTAQNALAFGSQIVYRDVARGCELLNSNNDKAVEILQRAILYGKKIINVAKLLVERMPDERAIICAIHCLDLLVKAAHNSSVSAWKNHDRTKESSWRKTKIAFSHDFLFFANLFDLFCAENDALKKDIAHFRYDAVGDNYWTSESEVTLRTFAYCIERGEDALNRYLNSVRGNEKNSWYNCYQDILAGKDSEAQEFIEIVGKYLCDNVENLQIKRILYHNNFFECVALEYAYKNKRREVADKIINNGYDYYLELGTLYIIRQYDRPRYYSEIKNLKVICLSRNVKTFKKNSFIRGLYGNVFCDEFLRLAKIAKKEIDSTDELDIRNRVARNIPDWAK